jgi:hypothetical protein
VASRAGGMEWKMNWREARGRRGAGWAFRRIIFFCMLRGSPGRFALPETFTNEKVGRGVSAEPCA